MTFRILCFYLDIQSIGIKKYPYTRKHQICKRQKPRKTKAMTKLQNPATSSNFAMSITFEHHRKSRATWKKPHLHSLPRCIQAPNGKMEPCWPLFHPHIIL